MRMLGIAGLVVAGLLVGCGGGGESKKSGKEPEWNREECGPGGYAFKSPWWGGDIGWFVQKMGDTSYTITNGNHDIDCAIDVNPLGEGQASLDDYVKADLDERKKNKGFEITAGPSGCKVGGGEGQRVTYKMKSHLWKNDGDGTQMEVITYALKGKSVVAMRTSCRTDYWEKRKNYFQEMHKSLSVK